jgi:hypothetical protein
MPKLNIPNRVKPNITKIQQLTDEEIAKFRNAELKASSMDSSSLATSKIISTVSEVEIPDAKEIAKTIIELYKVKAEGDSTLNEFVEDICEDMKVIGDERDKLNKNLMELLNINTIELSAKAEILQSEDEHTFCRAKIFTDLRPVFKKDISKGPQAMVIVHKLKLGYHEDNSNSHKDFHVSLDFDDLKTLREIIDRAEQKAESLKTSISNFKYLACS